MYGIPKFYYWIMYGIAGNYFDKLSNRFQDSGSKFVSALKWVFAVICAVGVLIIVIKLKVER